MILIPAIDLRAGRCVRLLRGDFDAETRYELAPAELLERYRALGARWLHVVDLDGARDGVLANRELVASLTHAGSMALQVGGGVRSTPVLEDLLASGVARAVIGSVAVEQPSLVARWLEAHGGERIVVALDVRVRADGVPEVVTRGWSRGSGLVLWDVLADYARQGLVHVLCTDVARDGALAGPNVELYAEGVRRFPRVAWQASGGIRDAADLAALARIGVAAAVSGKALIEQRIPAKELQPYLPDASFPASTSATGTS